MKHALLFATFFASSGAMIFGPRRVHAFDEGKYSPAIPRTWDAAAMKTLEVPQADAKYSPEEVSEDYYYQIPERPIYKRYPVYAPAGNLLDIGKN